MNFIYSKTTGGFYPLDMQADYEAAGTWPTDGVEVTQEQREALHGKTVGADANGFPVEVQPSAPTVEQLIAANVAAIQSELDRQAAAKGYDNILSACTYAIQPVGAPFQAEGAAFVAWRSAVWSQAHAILASVQAGEVVMPTTAQAVADMPAVVLP
ncbi:MAG: putative phage tail fiber protein [Herminiimonas sp.]|nr:putative phage tail fiber protein [Herminiimonas sp.]